MTRNSCSMHCLYYVNGRCRLEHRIGEKGGICAYYDGSTISRGRL